MARPTVDVVVPFRGGPGELDELRSRLGLLGLAPGDTLLIVDNTLRSAPPDPAGSERVEVLRAAERRTPAYARNRGAARGRAEWLLFIDADTLPSADLLERYFEPPPGERTGLVGGGVLDEVVPARGAAVARYAYLRRAASQDDTFRFGPWAYPKTANAACRRSAFEQVGGFREELRAAEDADLTYRLKAAGWEVERRERATVVHRNRQTLRSFVVQKALHGSGGAWLARAYPGSFLPRRRLGLVWWALRAVPRGLLAAARARDRDKAIWALLDPLELLVWELGRSLPNERPLRRAGGRGAGRAR